MDVVRLGKLAAGIGRDELLQLGHGLAAEIGAIHHEQHALRSGVLDEPVGEAARGVGPARAGGHLDHRARIVGGERGFEIGDAFDLAAAQVLRGKPMRSGQDGEARAQRL